LFFGWHSARQLATVGMSRSQALTHRMKAQIASSGADNATELTASQ
jgi:hypothetical protein